MNLFQHLFAIGIQMKIIKAFTLIALALIGQVYQLKAQETPVLGNRKTYNYVIPSQSSQTSVVQGQVVDSEGRGIPFANIGIRRTFYGAAADLDGYFTLRIPEEIKHDSITISCVGFQSLILSLDEMKNNKYFVLDDDISDLGQIEVQSERISPLDVIKEVIDRIPTNYCQDAYTQIKLYRKKSSYKGEYYIQEKIEEEYDEDGYQPSSMHGLGKRESYRIVLMGRIAKLDSTTNEAIKFVNDGSTFPTATAWSDAVNSRKNNFLSMSKHKKYNFQFNKESLKSADTIYIDFSIDKPSHRSTTAIGPVKFFGTIVINTDDYSVLEVHSTAVLDKDKHWKAKTFPAYKTEAVWWEKEIVKYQKIDNQYFFESLQRVSNYDIDKSGFIEILGSEISRGTKEPRESSHRPTEEYTIKKWNSLLNVPE